MKIVAVDIGNSKTSVAVVELRKVLTKASLANEQLDSLGDALDSIDAEPSMPVLICSVVPPITSRVVRLLKAGRDAKPLVIGKDIPLPMRLDLADVETVGADRVVCGAMAFERMETAVVVADFGTAVTVDCVDRDGVFRGGAIFAGLGTSVRALDEQASQLPEVKLDVSLGPWGRETNEAIALGVTIGAAGALKEIVERYATELGHWPEVIVTGGDAELVTRHCDFVHAVVPDLLLMGIELTHDYWRASKM